MLLFYTGVRRSASELERIKINEIHKHKEHYLATKDLVDEAMSLIVSDNCNIVEFGKLMQEGWCLKKAFAPGVSNNLVEEAYAEAQRRGAIGGKLLEGAGGGGFLLLLPNLNSMIKLLKHYENSFTYHLISIMADPRSRYDSPRRNNHVNSNTPKHKSGLPYNQNQDFHGVIKSLIH